MKPKLLFIIIVVALLAASITPQSASAQTQNITYTVQPYDTLGTIAYEYCTTWQAIYELNYEVIGPDPNLIYPGMVLTVPANCTPEEHPPAAWSIQAPSRMPPGLTRPRTIPLPGEIRCTRLACALACPTRTSWKPTA